MRNKFAWYISLVIIVFIASCRKHNQSDDNTNICVTRLFPNVNNYNVSAASLDSIKALFAANNLSAANLQFQSFGVDTTVNINPGAYNGYQEQVTAIQFINGLPVYVGGAAFTFNAGIYQPNLFTGYTGQAPNSDTTSHQSFPNLRNAFLAHVSESYTEGGALNSKPFIPSASAYVNSCLTTVLCYIDAAEVPGNAVVYNKNLIKVWLVTPLKDTSITYYPEVYVEDNGGRAWGVPFFIP